MQIKTKDIIKKIIAALKPLEKDKITILSDYPKKISKFPIIIVDFPDANVINRSISGGILAKKYLFQIKIFDDKKTRIYDILDNIELLLEEKGIYLQSHSNVYFDNNSNMSNVTAYYTITANNLYIMKGSE